MVLMFQIAVYERNISFTNFSFPVHSLLTATEFLKLLTKPLKVMKLLESLSLIVNIALNRFSLYVCFYISEL